MRRIEQRDGVSRAARVVLAAFPPRRPEAVAIVDERAQAVGSFIGPQEFKRLRERLASFEVFAAVGVRGLLRELGVDPAERRLDDLSPPRKTRRLNKQGRTLAITTAMLVQASCAISRPFGDPKVMRRYLDEGDHTKLRSRLESDAEALSALYAQGLLHASVRLRWGFLDERFMVPWVRMDEPWLRDLKQTALREGRGLEVVRGHAPGWEEPWSRAEVVRVVEGSWRGTALVDAGGAPVDDAELQLARLAPTGR